MKYLVLYENYEKFNRYAYLSWKRKNVTYRGTNDTTQPNSTYGFDYLGKGLYTAALSNKKMAKSYGELYYVVNAVPKKPKTFRNTNEWEIWMQNNLLKPYGYDKSLFSQKTSIKDEMIKLGYDGVIIIGREMVNYTPSENVKYFRYEEGVIDYYIRTEMEKN